MSFDTTSSTSCEKGAAMRLEKIGKKLLHALYRHHILGLAANAVWFRLFGKDGTRRTSPLNTSESI